MIQHQNYILHVEYSFVEMLSITAHSMCAQQTHGDGIREMNGSLKKEKTMRRENEVRRCVNGFYTSVRWYWNLRACWKTIKLFYTEHQDRELNGIQTITLKYQQLCRNKIHFMKILLCLNMECESISIFGTYVAYGTTFFGQNAKHKVQKH